MPYLPVPWARRDIMTAIDRLVVSADAKVLLARLEGMTVSIGQTIVAVGRQILSFAFEALKMFPNTAFGLVIGAVMAALIGSIAILGGILAPVLGPLLIACGIGVGAIADMRNDGLRTRINAFEANLKVAIDG